MYSELALLKGALLHDLHQASQQSEKVYSHFANAQVEVDIGLECSESCPHEKWQSLGS